MGVTKIKSTAADLKTSSFFKSVNNEFCVRFRIEVMAKRAVLRRERLSFLKSVKITIKKSKSYVSHKLHAVL